MLVRFGADGAEKRKAELSGSINISSLGDDSRLFLPSKIQSQRCIWQMRVIILWPRTDDRALAIVVILVAQIPIQPPVDFDRQPRFGRLVAQRIGRDQSSRRPRRISQAVALAVIFVDSV